MKRELKTYIYAAVFAALTFVATYSVRIPIPATEGYIHIGDSMIFASSMLFGPFIGCLTGAIGSALSDVVAGYPIYIIPTFLIKGIMGYVIGKLMFRFDKVRIREISGYVVSIIILVGGYYLAESIIYQSFITPVASLLFNFIQGVVGAIIGTIVYMALKNHIK